MADGVLEAPEIARYSRHLTLPQVGPEGQLKLKKSSALIVGAGGLGSPAALYLAAAGVGRVGIVDFDVVAPSNLQRQILYTTPDVGRSKLEAAKARLHALNPEIRIEPHEAKLSSDNALDVFRGYDLVVDGSDNFPTRYLVNDACVLLGIPDVYGSVFRFEGQASVFATHDGPCYRCLYPQPPEPAAVPSCAEGGVLGVVPGIVGLIQATEALKLLLGLGNSLAGRLLLFDALALRFRKLRLARDPACPACGDKRIIDRLIDYEGFCGGITPGTRAEIGPIELKRMIDSAAPMVLLDVREPEESQICGIPGSRLIPLNQLPASLDRLDKVSDIVVYCRSGIRSAMAVELLANAGFVRVRNLAGGILAWAEEIDPSMPTY